VDFDYAPEDVAFREELRDWIARNFEPGLDHREWHRRLVAGRWVVPDWPARWGGRDATLMQQVVYHEEMARADATVPRNTIGLWNIGPMLMLSGTAEQQARYLPPMVSADEIWCQGFSEPGAGSDLAALRTRAEDRGDHWLVTGEKIWTTFGPDADFCLALCRTNPGVAKHLGISALIIDMHAPGVSVRPLRELTGEEGFSQLVFDGAEVPKANLVGPVDGGWRVAMSTLTFERLGTMKLGIQLRRRLEGVIAVARAMGRERDPGTRRQLAALAVQVELMKLLTYRALTAMLQGKDPGATLPLGKLQWSYLMQDLAELAVKIEGPYGALRRGSPHAPPGDWTYHCLYSRMTTIGAGTTQVQKNILAQRVLGLPRGT
jgi:alkylation response protein AidB-like acyl-CoA dehydrogenase